MRFVLSTILFAGLGLSGLAGCAETMPLPDVAIGPNAQDGAPARLRGTVEDTPFDEPAEVWLQSWDGFLDLTASALEPTRGVQGMLVFGEHIEASELFAVGHRHLDPSGTLLCGQMGEDWYDEPAENVEIYVEEDDDGDLAVLLRAWAHDGARFQEVQLTLDANTYAPVEK